MIHSRTPLAKETKFRQAPRKPEGIRPAFQIDPGECSRKHTLGRRKTEEHKNTGVDVPPSSVTLAVCARLLMIPKRSFRLLVPEKLWRQHAHHTTQVVHMI